MKLISFLTLSTLLAISACSHHPKHGDKPCCKKEEKVSCEKDHCKKEEKKACCKDTHCEKPTKVETKTEKKVEKKKK